MDTVPAADTLSRRYLRYLRFLLPVQLTYCIWMGFFQTLPKVETLPPPVNLEGEMQMLLYHYVAEDLRQQQQAFDHALHHQQAHRQIIPLCILAVILVLFGLYRDKPTTAPGVILSSFVLMEAIALQSDYGIAQILLTTCFFVPALLSARHLKKQYLDSLSP